MSSESCTISAQVESSWDEILHVNVLDTLIQKCTRSTCTDEIPKNHSEASRGELKSGCTGRAGEGRDPSFLPTRDRSRVARGRAGCKKETH